MPRWNSIQSCSNSWRRKGRMGLLNRKTGADARTQRVEKEIAIVNRLGLHARPAALFVKVASRYRSDVWVKKENEEVNGKSIMGLMMLAAGQGSKLQVRCEGPDAARALDEIEQLINGRFNED